VQTITMLILKTSISDAIRVVALSLAGPLLAYLSIAWAWAAGERSREHGWHDRRTAGLLLASVTSWSAAQYVYGFFVSAPLLLLSSLGVGVLFTLLMARMARWAATARQERKELSPTLSMPGVIRLLLASVLVMILPLTLTEEDFWLPPEVFVFKGSPPFTGYLLKSEEDWLIIFEERRRIVVEFSKADLVDRDYCGPGSSALNRGRSARYLPQCPGRS
jgi:hypothetical protein